MSEWNGCCWMMTMVACMFFITTIFLCITKSLREQRHDITTQVLWRVILQLFNSIGGLRYYAITMRERAWMKDTMKVHKTFAMIAYQQAVSELETLAKKDDQFKLPDRIKKTLDLDSDHCE